MGAAETGDGTGLIFILVVMGVPLTLLWLGGVALLAKKLWLTFMEVNTGFTND